MIPKYLIINTNLMIYKYLIIKINLMIQQFNDIKKRWQKINDLKRFNDINKIYDKTILFLARSPTLSHLSASLQGITTIRAFGNQRTLEKEFDSLQNIHTSASYLNIALSRAFGFWLDSTCVLFIAAVVLSFVFTASSMSHIF